MSVFQNLYERRIAEIRETEKAEFNATRFTVWFNYYESLISSFKWKNLPKNTLPFQPEEYLAYAGMLAFFYDGDTPKIFPCYGSGSLLENGMYNRYTAIARNGKTWDLPLEDVEICFNNSLRLPSVLLVNEFAEKSTLALNSVDKALIRASMPKIIPASDETDMARITETLARENVTAVAKVAVLSKFARENINPVSLFNATADDVLGLWDVFVRYRNLFYTSFGINNVEIQKRERLTEAEGASNSEITRYGLISDMFVSRRDFCERVKAHFGYDLGVDLNRDTPTVYSLTAENAEKIEDVHADLGDVTSFDSHETVAENKEEEEEGARE